MYLPERFREDRLDVLHAFIERHPLATLVTLGEGAAVADHVPMLLARTAGPFGTLSGHVARANPVWRCADGQTVLVIFAGAQAYISPTWYEARCGNASNVPTWNYSVVHARGRIVFSERTRDTQQVVATLTDHHERAREVPWRVADLAPPHLAAHLGAIVAFDIVLDSLLGKFKASQNRSAADRVGVAAALASVAREVGACVELVQEPREHLAE